MTSWKTILSAILLPTLFVGTLYAGTNDGKLLATAGVTQIEGSAGGGLVPWAVISGYGSRDEVAATVSTTQVSTTDYRLDVTSAAIGLYDKVELSYAKQRFTLSSLGGDIQQEVFGAKVKLYGDAVYGVWPQVSAGLHHKRLKDYVIADAVGAKESSSNTDYYLAATKVHLGLAAGFNVVWNVTARLTKGNQTGFLGYGSASDTSHNLMMEGSAGILLSRNLVIGVEYRQKPDNLGLGEDDWYDIFVAYVPNKNVSLTLVWAKLGSIAGATGQEGLFLNLTGKLW
ncbi:DUF3034 family protein [Psychrosphaera algicola]|uniref:DUF3034 family protein n=1 Tax=Psychrosphaera algicola TaxID=3023714 RepID=A0ABT5F7K0_9GAMM|nr:DUF3034 family protein [Psychrosphaera sp. G1-22]MDC2887530.1 DUF3034 family protein [Psychrosphaera sp. G1-22]